MSDMQRRQFLLCFALLVSLLCFASVANTSDGESQKNEIENFFVQFNGCAWYKTPGDGSRDIYLELKDRTLTFYEYLKDEGYCYIVLKSCFTQEEIWQMKVAGYDTTLTDRRGNAYRIVIDRNGKTITISEIASPGGKEYITGTFVRLFCSERT